MSTTPWCKISDPITISSSAYGTALKAAVAHIIANDSNLEVHSVDTDTASTYKVNLRVVGTNDVIQIYNASKTIYYYYGYTNENDEVVLSSAPSTVSVTSSQSLYSLTYGMGDCFGAFVIGDNTSSSTLLVLYIRFTCDNVDGVLSAYKVLTGGIIMPNVNLSGSAAVETTYNIIQNGTVYTLSSTPTASNFADAIRYDSDTTKAFLPALLNFYSSNAGGYHNVRFGSEKKLLYVLYSGASRITAPVGSTVIVDGEELISMSDVIKFM